MEPTVYLYFNGNCEEAMRFYAETLGGEVTGVFRNGDMPDPESRMPGGDDMVMNMNMKLGTANIMASDAPGDWYHQAAGLQCFRRREFARRGREGLRGTVERRRCSPCRSPRPFGPSASRCSPTATARHG